MKVLFYGSLPASADVKVKQFLGDLVRQLLDQGLTLVTREGTDNQTEVGTIWVDNVILNAACEYRDQRGLPRDRVLSYAFDSSVGHMAPHDREIIRLPNDHRYGMYRRLLAKTDLLITVGGKEGVYRLGLFAAALRQTVLPLPFTGGTSETLWRELEGTPTLLPGSEDILGHLQPPSGEEVSQLAHLVHDHCKKPPPTESALAILEMLPDLPIHDVIRVIPLRHLLLALGVVLALISTSAGLTWTICNAIHSRSGIQEIGSGVEESTASSRTPRSEE